MRRFVLFVLLGTGCGVVVAVASWSKAAMANVTLAVDWAAIGVDASKANITAPPIPSFQDAMKFTGPAIQLQVPSAKGWLLDIRDAGMDDSACRAAHSSA